MAILKSEFKVVLPGQVYPTVLPAGSECPNEVVAIAKSLGLIDNKAIRAAQKNKAITKMEAK